MTENLEQLIKYKPIIMLDKNEPFEITAMGCTIFHETRQSQSFPKRNIFVDKRNTDFVIEYAIWYDYDIQHLYELEHVWVYVRPDGSVEKVEASFHGKFLNMVDLENGNPIIIEETHPVVYAQPGKHALVPDKRVIPLIPDWWESCMEKAGIDGVVVQEMFDDQIRTDDRLQTMTKDYIKEQFGFRPSMVFEPFILENENLMTWEELKQSIPLRVNRQMEIIRKYFKK